MTVSGDCKVLVAEFARGAVHTNAYPNRLSMVLAELNSGGLGEDHCWGSESHLAALQRVAEHLLDVTRKLEEERAREADLSGGDQ